MHLTIQPVAKLYSKLLYTISNGFEGNKKYNLKHSNMNKTMSANIEVSSHKTLINTIVLSKFITLFIIFSVWCTSNMSAQTCLINAFGVDRVEGNVIQFNGKAYAIDESSPNAIYTTTNISASGGNTWTFVGNANIGSFSRGIDLMHVDNYLYILQDEELYRYNLNTPASPAVLVGSGLGTATNGAYGAFLLDNAVSLAWAKDNKYYAIAGNYVDKSVLFQINLNTGTYVPNAFGVNKDYLPLTIASGFPGLTNIGRNEDMAFNPNNPSQLYADIPLFNGTTNRDYICRINFSTGVFTPINQVAGNADGLSFDSHGTLFSCNDDNLYKIDTTTGIVTLIETIANVDDFEGLDIDLAFRAGTDTIPCTTITHDTLRVSPTQTGITYSWIIPSCATIVGSSGDSLRVINWSNCPSNQYDTVSVVATQTSNSNCTDTSKIYLFVPSCPITIAGTVFNDVNGLTDNIVNGTGTNAGVTMYAVLYDNTLGVVLDTVILPSNGSFSFSATNGNNYTVYSTTTPATIGQTAIPTVTLPNGYVNTGEYNCENTPGCTGSDGTPNGILSLGVVNTNLTNANFGIKCGTDAGSDKAVSCFSTGSATMDATGSGTWTIGAGSAGTASITTPTSPTSSVTNFSAVGTYYLVWSNGCSDTAIITANNNCCAGFTFAPSSLPNGTQGGAYSQTLTASGGVGPYTWTIVSGTLPSGLSLSSSGSNTALISGTAYFAGTSTFTVSAKDANNCTQNSVYTITVIPQNCATQPVVPILWVFDEDATRMHLWSFENYNTPTTTATDYGRVKYQVPGYPGTYDFYNISSPDMESFAINPLTGIAYFTLYGRIKISQGAPADGPSSTMAIFSYDLNNAQSNIGSIVLTLIGHISTPNSATVLPEAMTYDPSTNRLYFADPVDLGQNSSTVTDNLMYVNLGAMNPNPLLATAATSVGLIQGLGETNNYVDGLEIDEFGNLFTVDGTDDDVYIVDKNTGAILSIYDNNIPGGVSATADVETIVWDPINNKLLGVDNQNFKVIEITPGNGANIDVSTFYPGTPGMLAGTDFEGSAIWAACTENLPTANADNTTTPEETPVTIPVLTNDTFGGDGPSTGTITVTDQPSNGTATVNDGGTPNDPTDDQIVYTPNTNFNGSDTLIYQICDANNDCDTALVVITITPVDDAPIANADTETTTEDTPLTSTVVPNDVLSGDGGNVFNNACPLCTSTSNGTLVFNSDGTYTYTPNANFNGTDEFIYQLCDVDGDCDTAIVTITINSTNDVPTANADTETTNEDTPVTIDVLNNDTFGGDGPSTGTITVTEQPTNGTVTVEDNGTPNDPTDDELVYTPNPNFNGSDTLIYQICDANNDCDTALVVITITPVDDAPIANADTETTTEDTPLTSTVVPNDVLSGDGGNVFNNACPLCTSTSNGTLVFNSDGTYTYTPNANFNGTDEFIYQLCDVDGDCDTAIVTITINSTNDVPTANADTETTNEDTPVTIDVLNNDTFGGDGPSTGTITVTEQPSNGTVTVEDNGTPNDPTDDELVYTPNPNFNGSDTLIYQICDANNDCDTALVVITITPVDDAPIANADTETTTEDTPLTSTVVPNDVLSGDGGNVFNNACPLCTSTSNGTLVFNSDGTYTYTPNANFNGTDEFIYQLCDVDGDCDTAIVTITINSTNDVPTANADTETTNEDTPVTIEVLTNDTFGGDGPSTGTITVTEQPSNGTVTVDDNGTPNDPTDDELVYTPNPNFNGSDTLIYQICDANNDCDTALVVITITPVDDAPIANADTETTTEDTPLTSTVVPNDVLSGDGGNVFNNACPLCTSTSNGTLVFNSDGTYTYTPNANFNGTDEFIYQLCDVDGDCDTAIVTITINSTNDVPTANADTETTNEDTPVTIEVLTNDTFGGDGPSTGTITVTEQPSNGTVTVDDNGTPNDPTDDELVYTPNPNFNGSDTLIYQICDANNDCDTALVVITITPVDDAPIANADTETTTEDTPLTSTVVPNDVLSGDGGNVFNNACPLCTSTSNGTLVFNSDGTYTYTPNANFNGTDEFIYQLCDVDGDCDTAIVTITINSTNDVPTANADTETTNEDTPVTIEVLTNDTFGGDGPSTGTITVTEQPSNGTVTVDDNGTPNDPTDDELVYTPNPNFNGSDTLIYQICDANNDCDTALVVITITPVDDAPIANADTETTTEDTPLTSTVVPNDVLSGDGGNVFNNACPLCTSTSNGTLVFNSDGTYTYTPNANFNGTDEFIYQLCDVDGDCDTAIVTITINSTNDVPTANADTETTNEDTPVTIEVLTNDTFGGDGPSTGTITVTEQPSNGTVTVEDNGTPNDPTDDELVYTPNPNFNGSDTLIYQICDANNDCDTALVVITITPVDDAPIANADTETTTEDTPLTSTVVPNDVLSGDGGNVFNNACPLCTSTSNGTLVFNSDGTYTYTPNANFNGTDEFIYQLCDVDGDCDTAIVTITINSTNDVPTANADTETTNEDTPVTIEVLTNDTFGGDGPSTGTITVTEQPSNGTVTVDDNGTPNDPTDDELVYTPNPNFNGSDTLIYQICDANNDCDTALVVITITPVDDAPIANADTETTTEDTPLTSTVVPNDVLSGDGGNVFNNACPLCTSTSNGTLVFNSDGTYTYTPNANFNGTDEFIYQLCDVDGDCDTAIVTITINSTNDVPTANADTETTNEDTPVTIEVLTNDTFGGDGPSTGTITVTEQPSNGTVTVDDNGTPNDPTDDELVYTPNPNFNGSDTLIYQICDANNDCDTALVVITITPVDDAPIANADTETTTEDTPLTSTVVPNDVLSGDGGNVFNNACPLCTSTSNGTLVFNSDGTYTYTPNANFNGTDEFIYQLCDVDGDCDTAIVTITINSTNDVPTANADTETTNEDTPVTIEVLTNDTFGGDGPSTGTITVTEQPSNGTVTVDDNGTPNDPTDDELVYTPNPNFNGSDTLIYQICDANNDCDTALVVITITPVDDAPIANADTETTTEDTPLTSTVVPNDVLSGDGGNVFNNACPLCTSTSNGTLVFNSDGTYTYTPNANFNGTDEFIYQLCDVDGDCDTAIVTITINSTNDVPTANADTETTNEDTPVTIEVLTNDTFGGDGPSTGTITVTEQPSNGTVTVDDNGTPNDPTDDELVYTPNPNFNGSDTLIYQICDANNDCDTALVVITITPVDDAPIANADTETTTEDTPLTSTVVPNDVLSGDGGNVFNNACPLCTSTSNGTLVFNSDGTYTYTPNANFNGTDEFIYQLCDVDGDCDTAIVTITINSTNDVPTANADTETTNEDTPVTIEVLTNDTFGGDGPSTGTITVTEQPSNGTVTVDDNGTPNDPTDDELVYTPNPNFNGSDTLIYQICDANNDCDTALVVITITPVDDAPIANADTETTTEDTPLTSTVVPNDVLSGDGGNVFNNACPLCTSTLAMEH
jgi:hypothetical protein